MRTQVGRAVAAGEPYVRLRLLPAPGTPARALEYRQAVQAGEALAEDGTLMSAAQQLQHHHRTRDASLSKVIAAAQS